MSAERHDTRLALKDFARELTAASEIDPDPSHCHGCAPCIKGWSAHEFAVDFAAGVI